MKEMKVCFGIFQTVLRIWDCLFYEGNKILMRVAVTLIVSNEQNILMSQDFGSLVECFKKIAKNAQAVDCHTFMQVSYEIIFLFFYYYLKLNVFMFNKCYQNSWNVKTNKLISEHLYNDRIIFSILAQKTKRWKLCISCKRAGRGRRKKES